MVQNFRCKFKGTLTKVLAGNKNIILFQSRVNRHVCDVIDFMINVILSILLFMQ